MSFEPKIIFKFNNGEEISMDSLVQGYDFKIIDDLQKSKDENKSLHIGHPRKEVSRSARDLASIEILLD